MQSITIERTGLREMWLHVTFRCNLECSHCLFGCGADYDRYADLSLDDAKKYAEYAISRGASSIYITGGEPLTWKPLKEFLEYLEEKDYVKNITLLTNGTLVNDEWAGFFRGFQKLTIRMSLECYTRETNDSFRGRGSFLKTVSGIRALNDRGIKPWICFTNKGGGALVEDDRAALEQDFMRVLREERGVEIEGLKVLGLYGKGRMDGVECAACGAEGAEADGEKLSRLQCAYGAAAGPAGIAPCPILVDAPEACVDMEDALDAKTFTLSHECCLDCFRTGSTCGQ